MIGLYLLNTAWQKIKVQLKEIEGRKFQLLTHFVSGFFHHHNTEHVMKMYTAIFLDLCDMEVVKCPKNSLAAKPQFHEWRLGCSFLLRLVIVSGKHCAQSFCFIFKAARHLSHNLRWGWRLDSGGRIQCARSVASAQTCPVYKHKRVSFPLSHCRSTFIRAQAQAALTKREGLFRLFCIIFMGCVSSMFLHEG